MSEQLQLFEPCPPPSTDVEWIYFAVRRNTVKIGRSHDVARRMRELDTKLLFSFPGDNRTEIWFHRRVRRSRIVGEWYAPTPEVLSLLEYLRGGEDRQSTDAAWDEHVVPIQAHASSDSVKAG